jgi:octaprenyl-diphosphate synthase
VQQLVDHCADFQGKRLRPALVLLAGQACGSLSEDHAVLAAVVEMIHTATLVHDDVLDEAVIRRHAATVNAEWGNETAVLLGDYLFTHAFHLAASLESTRACRWIGEATNKVCEGEMQQIHHRGNLELDENDYFAIIEGKTAELTAVSCRLGAWYARASEPTVAALDRYGRNLGIAFQIADDVLDIWGEERTTGKSLGTDLEKQKLTLPIIRLLSLADPAAGATIRGLLREAKADGRRRLRPYLEETGALEYAWQRAKQHVRLALDELDRLAESPAKSALRTLAQYVMRRPS